jgi:hypothetical protein
VTYRTVANGDKAPPAVSRPFVAIDDGNCSPRYLRATTYYLPQTREAAALAKLPLALICRPMAAPADGEVRTQQLYAPVSRHAWGCRASSAFRQPDGGQ